MAERIYPGTRPEQRFMVGFGGDLIDVSTLNAPDPTWKHLDNQGHEHRWQDGTLPTLVRIMDYEGDDEYPAVFHYECKACRELEDARERL